MYRGKVCFLETSRTLQNLTILVVLIVTKGSRELVNWFKSHIIREVGPAPRRMHARKLVGIELRRTRSAVIFGQNTVLFTDLNSVFTNVIQNYSITASKKINYLLSPSDYWERNNVIRAKKRQTSGMLFAIFQYWLSISSTNTNNVGMPWWY